VVQSNLPLANALGLARESGYPVQLSPQQDEASGRCLFRGSGPLETSAVPWRTRPGKRAGL